MKTDFTKLPVALFIGSTSIYQLRPELEPQYKEVPEEEQLANRRLGEALIAAYDLADQGEISKAIELLSDFAANEPSEYHRELATVEIERLWKNYGA